MAGLFTASKDCSVGVIDVNELKIVAHLSDAHDSPINVVQEYDENILVTGDDAGDLAVCSIYLCLCRFTSLRSVLPDMGYSRIS